MQKQDGGHAVFKVPVLCLVAEVVHAQDTSQAAAKKRGEKKRGFRNAPCTPDSPLFIYAHYCVSCYVDDCQIKKEDQ